MQQHYIIITFTVIGILSTAVMFSALNAQEPYFGEFHILFESNSDKISAKYYSDLDKLGRILTFLPYTEDQILIQGRTDSTGSAFDNQLLSEKRAESIKRYLLQHFPLLLERRLMVRGYGSTRPLAPNDTEEGRSKNRSVLIIIDKRNFFFRGVPSRGVPSIRGAASPSGGPPEDTPFITGTGLAYLVGNQPEDQGYGLYSYLLFASPPTHATRDRYQAAVTAYLEFISPIKVLEEYLQRRQLNITYLPLTVSLPERILPQESTQWILEHYNYTRARILLSTLPGAHSEGPYIVSSRKPLRVGKILAEPYLYQDLSWVPPRLVELWVKAFLNQATQERFWEERTAERWVRKLRTAIAILAEGLPEVHKASAELPKKRLNVQKELIHRIVGNH